MLIEEMSNLFDIYYSNITSNQAPGLTEYEKSVFLTKGEKETVLNHFSSNSKGNNLGLGFDDSAKRQADFSVLMKTSNCTALSETGGTAYLFGCTFTPTGGTTVTISRDMITFTADDAPYTVPSGTYATDASGNITVGTDTVVVKVNGVPLGAGSLVVSDVAVGAVGKIDDRSSLYSFPADVFIAINETIKTAAGNRLQIIPLRYDQYTNYMSKPFKRPLKNQAWRLMNSSTVASDSSEEKGTSTKFVEIITNSWDTISSYSIRYVRVPRPILTADFTADGLTIDGESHKSTECELDPILHEEVLQRAVELAKIAWTATGNDNAQAVLAAGQRSE